MFESIKRKRASHGVGMVSPFRRALGLQISVRNSVKRKIARSFAELEGDGTNLGPAGSTSRVSFANPQAKLRNVVRHSTRANQPQMKSSAPVPRQPAKRAQSPTPSRRLKSEKKSARSLARGRQVVASGDTRNRKSIANTQADKKGTDSAGLTSLQTSGIDGKGLKINQIR